MLSGSGKIEQSSGSMSVINLWVLAPLSVFLESAGVFLRVLLGSNGH